MNYRLSVLLLTLLSFKSTFCLPGDGYYGLFGAIELADYANFKQSLQYGADVNGINTKNGNTPAMELVLKIIKETVEAHNAEGAAFGFSLGTGMLTSMATLLACASNSKNFDADIVPSLLISAAAGIASGCASHEFIWEPLFSGANTALKTHYKMLRHVLKSPAFDIETRNPYTGKTIRSLFKKAFKPKYFTHTYTTTTYVTNTVYVHGHYSYIGQVPVPQTHNEERVKVTLGEREEIYSKHTWENVVRPALEALRKEVLIGSC